MRPIVLLVAASLIVGAQPSIRTVTFTNFSYPWPGRPTEWPSDMKWLKKSEAQVVRLQQGRWQEPDNTADDRSFDRSKLPFAGFTLDEVVYGDVTRDGKEDAIVVLRFDTGGTQYHYYVYIYEVRVGRPQLAALFRSGDRSSHGLYRVYAERGNLAVELFDPDKSSGDCCSEGILRQRYYWSGVRFQPTGGAQTDVPKAVTRRPVTIFGQPQ